MRYCLFYFSFGLILFLVGCSESKQKENPLLGSWAINEVQWISADTSVTRTPVQKGIFLVTPNRYSICWTALEKRRTPFNNLSTPTEEEILQGFQSVVFNTGSYSLSENTLMTEAHMAKVPGFEGGLQYYDYKIIDDQMTLTLFDETYPDGKKPQWFGNWRTRFSLTRLSDPVPD